MTEARDPTLDVLLDLDGQILVVDPEGAAIGSSSWSTVCRRRARNRMASIIRLPCTALTANDSLVSTMRIRLAARSAAGRRIIGIGYGPSAPTIIRTQQPYLRTSGRPSMRSCANEE